MNPPEIPPAVNAIADMLVARAVARGWGSESDLKAEAEYAIARAIVTFDASHGTRFETWASVSIQGRLRSFARYQAMRAAWPLYQSATPIVHDKPGPTEQAEFWAVALAGLPERDCRVITAHYQEGRTPVEISEAEGLSSARVYQILGDVKGRIKRNLKAGGYGE